jgi:basic membrane protein A
MVVRRITIFLIAMSFSLASCSLFSEDSSVDVPAGATDIVCLVTDTKGLGDRSFNDTAWKGVTDAKEEHGIEPIVLESAAAEDYGENINECIELGSILNVTVGFLIGDATASAADAEPDEHFAIVDYSYDPAIDNVLGLEFSTNEAAFLAGYLAAGVTKTGRVGTFGGVNIPTVTIFMDGFTRGVHYYNEVHNTEVEVIGWDPELKIGLFTDTFDVVQRGVMMGEVLIEKGVDIIMPVAGGVGQGTAMVAMERGGVFIIGVDTDWTVSSAEFSSITLTSVLKRMDLAVFEAIGNVLAGAFSGGTYIGTLENNGVGLAPFHELNDLVSTELAAELEEVKSEIIAGSIPISP